MKINDYISCPICHDTINLINVSEMTTVSIYRGYCKKCDIIIEKQDSVITYHKRYYSDYTSSGYSDYSGIYK
jgi:C4-type Zn-finger protein